MTEPATDAVISLRTAAAELALHYMTVYRYVRTGRLPAVKLEGEWRVKRSDLALLREPVSAGASSTRVRYRSRLQDRLLAADEPGAWAVIESALSSGADVEEVYLRLLIPAMRDIGQRWEAGDLAVLDEHQATAVAIRLVGRLGPRFRRPGRRRGALITGAVSGDTHALAPALLADLLRGRRFDVVDLGGDTPVESFVEVAASTDALRGVLLSCSTPEAVPQVAATIQGLRAAGCGAAILAGGRELSSGLALELGADSGGTTAEEALDQMEVVMGRTPA